MRIRRGETFLQHVGRHREQVLQMLVWVLQLSAIGQRVVERGNGAQAILAISRWKQKEKERERMVEFGHGSELEQSTGTQQAKVGRGSKREVA